jgi:3',5'-cyclic-AMP phosphodiesterase
MLVLQMTDTHLFADSEGEMFGCRTRDTFDRVIEAIAQLETKPDLLLLTGDISQDESVASYVYVQSRLQDLNIRSHWLPGNHDQGEKAIAFLNGGCVSAQKDFVLGGWQFILLDSMVPQQPYGELSPQQLAYLDSKLETDLPTLIAVHHQVIDCGLTYMDGMGLRNAGMLLERLGRSPQVKVVLNGHIHHEFSELRDGVHFLGTPSTCMQLKPMQEKAELDDRPAGFRLLWLGAEGEARTEVRRLSSLRR